MKAYPDTSFLCALYRNQDNSDRALTHRESMTTPLPVTQLLLWEFRQSVRFQAFRHSRNSDVGYPLAEAEKMIAKVNDHLKSGDLKLVDCDLHNVLILGERLSKTRTFPGGHRSFDILHVATALELDASGLLSFDANQNALASTEGLETPLGS